MPRPVQLPWKCRGCGDCCRAPEIVMTPQERAEVLAAMPKDMPSPLWLEDDDEGFAHLMAGPCPFLTENNRCCIYEARPFNCRRFRCYRVEGEPFEADEYGNCLNLTDRLRESRLVRRDYATKQRHAQRWAVAHGWKDTP